MKVITQADIDIVLRVIKGGRRNDLRYALQREVYDYLTSLPTSLRDYEPALYSNVMASIERHWEVRP